MPAMALPDSLQALTTIALNAWECLRHVLGTWGGETNESITGVHLIIGGHHDYEVGREDVLARHIQKKS